MGPKFTLTHHPSFRQTKFLAFLCGFVPAFLFTSSVMFAQEITGLEIDRTIEHQNYSVSTLDNYFKEGHQLIAYSNISGLSDNNNILVIYDFSQDQVLAEIPGMEWSYDIKFIDSDQLLFRNGNTLYQVENFNSPEVNVIMNGVITFTVSDDKSVVAMLRLEAGFQVEIAGYNSNTGSLTPMDVFEIPDDITSSDPLLAFSPDGNYIALTGGYENNNVHIINIGTGSVSTVTTPDNAGTYSPAFYEQNGELRLAIGGGYANGGIEVINVTDLDVEASIPVFGFYNYSLAFDPTQQYVVTGGFDGIIKIFNVEGVEFNEVYDSNIGFVSKIMFTQDNQYVLSGHGPGPLVGLVIHRILDEPSGISVINKKPLVVHPNPVSSVLNLDGVNHEFIYVYNVTGQVVLSEESSSSSVDVSTLPGGIYMLKTLNNQEIRTAMFVKD